MIMYGRGMAYLKMTVPGPGGGSTIPGGTTAQLRTDGSIQLRTDGSNKLRAT